MRLSRDAPAKPPRPARFGAPAAACHRAAGRSFGQPRFPSVQPRPLPRPPTSTPTSTRLAHSWSAPTTPAMSDYAQITVIRRWVYTGNRFNKAEQHVLKPYFESAAFFSRKWDMSVSTTTTTTPTLLTFQLPL